MRYRLAIFDSDGTLADTLPWMRSVFNELADRYNFRRVLPSEQETYRDLHGAELLNALALPFWKLPLVINAMRARMAEHRGELALFPGISEVLQELSSRGVLLAVVSSNSRANVERILGPTRSGRFARYECGVSMFGKAARIRAVTRAMKVSPAQTIYIGDEIRDAEAARKAGVSFGGVAWGQCSVGALQAQQPAEFFRKPEELARLTSPAP